MRTRRLPADVEDGLRDLIAAGRVTSDGYEGLRAIASGWSSTGRRRWRHTRRAGRFAVGGPPGRWSILEPPVAGLDADDVAEAVARTLLDRYGVVFRDAVRRESFRLPWRDVLRALRRLEARGDVRGGRFVAGFSGEQFALPDAVNALRRARREPGSGETLRLAAVDPLNLTGVITPTARIPAQPGRSRTLINGWPPPPDPGAADVAASCTDYSTCELPDVAPETWGHHTPRSEVPMADATGRPQRMRYSFARCRAVALMGTGVRPGTARSARVGPAAIAGGPEG